MEAAPRPGAAKPPPAASGLDLMRLLNRGKWHIVTAMLLGMVGGYLYSTQTPPVYRSAAHLLLQPRLASSELLAAAQGGGAMFAGAEEASLLSRLSTYARIFTSATVIEEAVADKANGILELPSFKVDPGSASGRIPGNLRADRPVERGSDPTYILTVSYASAEPKEAATVLKGIISSFTSYVNKADAKDNTNKIEKAAEYVSSLERDRNAKAAELNRLMLTFEHEALAGANPDVAAPGTPRERKITSREFLTAENDEKLALEKLTTLKSRLAEYQSDLRIIKRGMAANIPPSELLATLPLTALLKDGESSLAGIDGLSLAIMHLRGELKALDDEEAAPKNPKRMRAQRSLDILLEEQGANNDGKNAGDAATKLKLIVATRNAAILTLPDKIASQEKEADEFNAVADVVRARKAKINAARDHIANLDKQIENVGNQKRAIELDKQAGVRVRELSHPQDGMPESPLMRFLMFGAAIGLVCGLVAAYLLEISDQSFRSADEIQQTLGVKLLGHISTFRAARAGEDHAVMPDGAAPDTSVVAFYRPRARIAEDYRAVRTGLLYGLGGESRKVLQITSPNPGDGKSTLCANLAVTIARTGKRVALVDADWRRPRVEKLFNLDNSVGITNVLRGEATLADALRPSCVENLFLLPCGLPKPENPAEMLVGPEFPALLDELRTQFDLVLLDTPPVLAVSDPCSIAPLVDGVVLTININGRARTDAVRAAEQLEDVGAKLLGVVVNRVASVVGYGDYGYQGYAYGTHYYGRSNSYYAEDEPDGRATRAPAANGPGRAAPNAVRPLSAPARPPEPVAANGSKAEAPRPPSSMDDLLRGLRQKFGEIKPPNGDEPKAGGAA